MATELTVTDMTCEGCEAVVETAIEMADGVDAADADRREQLVTVEGALDEDEVTERVRMAGYDVSE